MILARVCHSKELPCAFSTVGETGESCSFKLGEAEDLNADVKVGVSNSVECCNRDSVRSRTDLGRYMCIQMLEMEEQRSLRHLPSYSVQPC